MVTSSGIFLVYTIFLPPSQGGGRGVLVDGLSIIISETLPYIYIYIYLYTYIYIYISRFPNQVDLKGARRGQAIRFKIYGVGLGTTGETQWFRSKIK